MSVQRANNHLQSCERLLALVTSTSAEPVLMADPPTIPITCLVLDEDQAKTITTESEKPYLIPMHYQCRSMEKGKAFPVLFRQNAAVFAVVGRASFGGNRRMCDEKIIYESKTENGKCLPKNQADLKKLKDSFDPSRKTLAVWELVAVEQFPDPLHLLSSANVILGSDAGLQDS